MAPDCRVGFAGGAEVQGQDALHFRDGLRHYLKKHKYANAETNDLWNALQKASGKQVGRIMANWTGKPGYPIVHVGQDGGKLTIQQERFYLVEPKTGKKHTPWHIPLLDDRLGGDGTNRRVVEPVAREQVPRGFQDPFAGVRGSGRPARLAGARGTPSGPG